MPYEIYYLKAKVGSVNSIYVACRLPVLGFLEDSVRIRMATNRNDLVYTVIDLPATFAVQNKNLYVSVAVLKPEEEFACTTLGISYPHLKILDVKARD